MPAITPTITPTPSTTPILCGSGVTTGNYYYTDCCGNLAQGTDIGTTVIMDYTKPFNGVVKLNMVATTSCPTPTPTPTPTVTPSVSPTTTPTPTVTVTPSTTKTPLPTPTNYPVVQLKNECDVFTLFDLGVQCYPVELPSSSTSSDGILSLKITGGTTPYSIYWQGGQRSQTLVGIPAGNYEVIVVDYYGDYSSTTICSLLAPSPTPTATLTPTPTITPSPSWPNLCLIVSNGQTTYGPFQFVPNGNQNGKPTWVSGIYTTIWNINQQRWEVQGWNYGGLPVSTNQTDIPDSAWTIANGVGSVSMTQGTCSSYLPLKTMITTQNSSCNGLTNCNGSITINVSGGLAPYSYSINNGLTYQLNNNIFTSLCPNTYTVIVKDSLNNTVSQVINVGYDSLPISYTIGVEVNGSITENIIPNQDTETSPWKVSINPPLPLGTVITFQLTVNFNEQIEGPWDVSGADATANYDVFSNVYKNNVLQTPVILPQVTSYDNRPYCNAQIQTKTWSNTYNLTMGYGDEITGITYSQLNIVIPTLLDGCVTTVVSNILSSTSNAVIDGCTCCVVVNNPSGQGIINQTLQGTLLSLT